MPRRLRHLPGVRRDRRTLPGISRRHFLKLAAVGAGALTAHALPRLERRTVRAQADRPRIVIVGAGAAGLTCAYELERSGLPVTGIYDANDRIGGRMYSLDRFGGQGNIEAGGEFIDGWHTELLDLCEALGLPLIDTTDFNDAYDDRFWFGGRWLTDRDYEAAWAAVSAALDADYDAHLDGYDDVFWDDHPDGARLLDALSADAWMTRAGLDDLSRAVLGNALVGEFGRDPDCLSALLIFYLLGYLEPSMLPTRPDRVGRTYQIGGGNGRLPAALAARLTAPLTLGARLIRLTTRPDNGYRLTFDRAGALFDVDTELVMLGLPFTALRQVDLQVDLPDRQRRCINELGYGTNAKLFLHADPRVWEQQGLTGAFNTDSALQSTWETVNGRSGSSGILVNYLGGAAGIALADGTTADQAAAVSAPLDRAFPGFSTAFTGQADRVTWPTLPGFLGSYACYLPGQMTLFRGVEGQRAGRIRFIGEHTSRAHQGYMNGAVATGLSAAWELLG